MRGCTGRRSREDPPGARVLAADAASEVGAREQLCSCGLTCFLPQGWLPVTTDCRRDAGRRRQRLRESDRVPQVLETGCLGGGAHR